MDVHEWGGAGRPDLIQLVEDVVGGFVDVEPQPTHRQVLAGCLADRLEMVGRGPLRRRVEASRQLAGRDDDGAFVHLRRRGGGNDRYQGRQQQQESGHKPGPGVAGFGGRVGPTMRGGSCPKT